MQEGGNKELQNSQLELTLGWLAAARGSLTIKRGLHVHSKFYG
jgi:hypothetical protein